MLPKEVMQYTQDTKTVIFHAMLPSEPEPSVTYAFVTEEGGSMVLKFPQLFIELGDDFERWYKEERHVLLRDFYNDYRQNLEHKGNYYAKLIYDEFTIAWEKEQYYKKLIEIWEDWNTKHLEKQEDQLDAKNYQQANYYQEKINENRLLMLKAKAALYFIVQTKAFVKPDFGIPDIIPPTLSKASPPAPTSTGANEESKITLTHAQICLLYIFTKRPINKNNAQEIAEQYGQTSRQKLADKYGKMFNALSERISSRFAVRDIERVIKLLSDPNHLDRARDELRQAKALKGIDQ